MPLPQDSLLELSRLRDANQLARSILDEKEGSQCFIPADKTSSGMEQPIDSMISVDIWGAQEYLADKHSKMDYARERLKNSRQIIQKSEALLYVPMKCSYETVESTDELTRPDVDHDGERELPEQSMEGTEFHMTVLDDDSFDDVSFKDVTPVIEAGQQSAKSTSSSGCDTYCQGNPPEFSDKIVPSNEKMSDDPTSIDSKERDGDFFDELLFTENSPMNCLESILIKSNRDDSDFDTFSKNTQYHNDTKQQTSDTTDTKHLPYNIGVHVYGSFDIIPEKKQKSEELKFKRETPTGSMPKFDCFFTKNHQPQDRRDQNVHSGSTKVINTERSKINESALLAGAPASETTDEIKTIPQMSSKIDDLRVNFVGRQKQSHTYERFDDKIDNKHLYPKLIFSAIPSNTHRSVWDTLPNEIVLMIFSFLTQSDLKQVALACHRFYAIAKDHCLWSKLDIDASDITSSLLDNFTRVRKVKITRSKAKALSNKCLRTFFQNSKDTLTSLHLSHCFDKYLCGDNILLHIATHCRKVNSITVPWTNTTDNGIDALVLSNLMLRYFDISGNCFISDNSFVKFLQKSGAILETLKVNGCFALTQNSFVAIANNCDGITVLEIGLCPKIAKDNIILISSALKNLQELDLRALNAVDDYCLDCIAKNCKLLTKLVLANCKSLSNNGISNLAYDLPDLTSLDLSGCSNISDDGCCSLAHALNHPNHLDFSSTLMSHVSVFALTENFYHCLESLKISFCNNITQDCVEKLISFCFKLTILHVHGCKRIDVKKLQENYATLLINK